MKLIQQDEESTCCCTDDKPSFGKGTGVRQSLFCGGNRYKTDGLLNIASMLEQCHAAVRAGIMVTRALCSRASVSSVQLAKAVAYLCWFCKD